MSAPRYAAWWAELKVDACDEHLLSTYEVHVAKQPYGYRRVRARCKQTGRRFVLARLIMAPPPGMFVDHINGDTLDNRRCNLRICTRAENSRNKRPWAKSASRFKGVHRWKHKWSAQIDCDGRKYLGVFEIEEEAARAYDAAAREMHGVFAALNFPRDGETACQRDAA